jgi:hypothetical protein
MEEKADSTTAAVRKTNMYRYGLSADSSDLSQLDKMNDSVPMERDRKRISSFFGALYLVSDLGEVSLGNISPVKSLGFKRARTSTDLSSLFESSNSLSDSESSISLSDAECSTSSNESEEWEQEEDATSEEETEDCYHQARKRHCSRTSPAEEIDEDESGALFF